MMKKGILFLLSVIFLMSHNQNAFAVESFSTISTWGVTSSNSNFLGFTEVPDLTWKTANIPSRSSRNIYSLCLNIDERNFTEKQYFSAVVNILATQPSINNTSLSDGSTHGLVSNGGLGGRTWGNGLKTVVYEDVTSSSNISPKSISQFLGRSYADNIDSFVIDQNSELYNAEVPTLNISHAINGYVTPGVYDKICFSGHVLVWDTRQAPVGSSTSNFLFFGGRINWFDNNQEATNDSIQNYNQQQEQAKDNIANQSTDDIQDTENENTTSLISLFGSFVGVLTSASASNCSINGSLTNNFNMGMLNFCKDEPPPFVSIIGSIFVIVVFIPLAYFMVRRIIGEIRSFTDG